MSRKLKDVENDEIEYMTKTGGWTKKSEKAHLVSEEDAKVFVRVLKRSDKGADAKKYDFDYVVIGV